MAIAFTTLRWLFFSVIAVFHGLLVLFTTAISHSFTLLLFLGLQLMTSVFLDRCQRVVVFNPRNHRLDQSVKSVLPRGMNATATLVGRIVINSGEVLTVRLRRFGLLLVLLLLFIISLLALLPVLE